MHYMDANKTAGEKTGWQLHKNAACNPEQVLAAAPHKTPTVKPYTCVQINCIRCEYLKLSKSGKRNYHYCYCRARKS